MTEEEWLNFAHPLDMLEVITRNQSERKYRLLAGACCRCVGPADIAELCEQCADGRIRPTELQQVRNRRSLLDFAIYRRRYNPIQLPASAQIRNLVLEATEIDASFAVTNVVRAGYGLLQSTLSDFMRDIFGNPFRPVPIDPRWLTSTVIDLADAIYTERAFDRMPILADALMDAGCDSDEMIQHCRGPGPHVRGCWVVDLLLGKE